MAEISYEFISDDSQIIFTFSGETEQLNISYASDVDLGAFVNKLIDLIEKGATINIECDTTNKNDKEQIISSTIDGIVEKFNQVIQSGNDNNQTPDGNTTNPI